jgi:predicted nucleic acid-binding protein
MAVDSLIDTGAALALLDGNDPWHEVCAAAFQRTSLPLLTSTAVLTEMFHFLQRKRIDMEIAWSFLSSGAVVLGSIRDDELPSLHALMSKYADRPMDFADATLVHLAQRESLAKILTVDHDDFETYRIDGRKAFQILPSRRR